MMKSNDQNQSTDSHQRPRRTGAAIVEAALALPVFMVMLLGIIEFGQAMMVQQVVTTAARDACRNASLRGSTNTNVRSDVEQFLSNSIGVSAGDVTVTFSIIGATGSSTNGTEVSTAGEDDVVTVQVRVPYNAVSFGVAPHLANASLQSSMTMRHE